MLNISKTITVISAGLLLSGIAQAQTARLTVDSSASISTATTAVQVATPEIKTPSATTIEGLELLEKIGRYEHKLVVYKAEKPTEADIAERLATSERFATMAGIRFNEKPTVVEDTRIALSGVEDASASFEVDQNTGNFLFESGMEKYGKEASTPYLPKDAQLEELALRTLEQFDLGANPNELKVDHIGGLNLSVADGKSEPRIYEKLKTIRFQRVLDGVPVMGDGRLVMHFGERAELSGLIYQLPKIGSARELSPKLVQTPESMQKQAFEELTAMAKKAMRSKLTTVDLVLYDDGLGVMEPAYHVVMERMINLDGKEPTMIPYDFYLPVSSQPIAFFPHMDVSLFVPEEGSNPEGGIVGKAD